MTVSRGLATGQPRRGRLTDRSCDRRADPTWFVTTWAAVRPDGDNTIYANSPKTAISSQPHVQIE